ncbi:cytochrome c, partial [Klebsiella pneumoniae]|uniref:c-type cytochrome n=1 Tax=Klebsiella pneumoniae TaxID=573 RepID=UPI00226FC04B
MKKTTLFVLAAVLVFLPVISFADGAATFAAKCKACHGADGKKLVKADLTSAAIQAKADADLVKFLTTDAKHKSKVAN